MMKMHAHPLAATCLALALSAAGARAHAFLDHASPLVGSTVSAAPHEVRLWFTQAVEPSFSAAQVRSSGGAVVGSTHVDPVDHKQLVIPVRALPRTASQHLPDHTLDHVSCRMIPETRLIAGCLA
jgi:methionine-rich copper-binding protein CopC